MRSPKKLSKKTQSTSACSIFNQHVQCSPKPITSGLSCVACGGKVVGWALMSSCVFSIARHTREYKLEFDNRLALSTMKLSANLSTALVSAPLRLHPGSPGRPNIVGVRSLTVV